MDEEGEEYICIYSNFSTLSRIHGRIFATEKLYHLF